MVTTHCSQIWSKLEMICKVRHTIEKYNLLENVHSLAVGVSGGADSVCLIGKIKKSAFEPFSHKLTEITGARCEIKLIEEKFDY